MEYYHALKQAAKTDQFLSCGAHATDSPHTRHSHISYVQIGPDFIHWCELQGAGIQDELKLFNEHQVLSLAAP